MTPNTSTLAILLGTTSFLTIANALEVKAQQQVAQGQMTQTVQEEVPEQVLVTGSLIHGTAAVGVPVTSLGTEDFKETGALTVGDLLKNVPSITAVQSLNVATSTGGNFAGSQKFTIHNIGTGGSVPRALLMIDGKRVPTDNSGLCAIDASIIPQLAIDRIDVLADGASATYGADAVSGVLNVILKRGYDGAISQVRVAQSLDLGGFSVGVSQLYGKKWDSGDVTVTYEYYHNAKVQGPGIKALTMDFSPWGLDNRNPIVNATPGIVSTGKPTQPAAAPSGFDPAFGTSCNNCYSIPKGQNGVGLTWAAILANPGVQNAYNPYVDSWLFPDVQRNAFVLTFDQDIYKSNGILQSVQFYAEGFYNHRRNITHYGGTATNAKTNAITLAIPTTNPYYPVGAPAGLRMAYNYSKEIPNKVSSGVQNGRWEGGFNLELPADWRGKISYSKTEDHADDKFKNNVNLNLANAAVGNVVAAASGFASYTKPSNIPYLNLFCDPDAFKCNDPVTLAYITSNRNREARQVFNEANATFDGPLFDLPGGTVRAAVGGDYLTQHFTRIVADGTNSQIGDAAPTLAPDGGGFWVWAAFAQLNVPIVGESNGIPLVKSLELELSGRIDHYSNVGTTKNPKIALNWNVGAGLTLRGTTGTSFRAPNFIELSNFAGPNIVPINVVAGENQNSMPTCPVLNVPALPNTAAAILDPNCTAALQYLGGINLQGSAGARPRIFGQPLNLKPETARNWAAGFDFAPTDFLNGLDLNFTLYNVKVSNIITPTPLGTGLDDPIPFANGLFVLKTDPNFATYVANIQKEPQASPLIIPAGVTFIEDRLYRNTFWSRYQGIDFSASYDLDAGDLGAWNTGIAGNYVLKRVSFDGVNLFDSYKDLDSGGRLNYRARLGWAGGPESAWNATLYMNWHAHVGTREASDAAQQNFILPPPCFMIGNAPCNASGLPQFAQYTKQFAVLTNYEPAWVTFDLALGYKTGDTPANDYLKNLSFQFVINNFMNRKPNFLYAIGNNPRAFDSGDDPSQRFVSFVITKVW